jgi:hypothetical protein
MDKIKQLWNDHPVKRWFVIGLAVGWVLAQAV